VPQQAILDAGVVPDECPTAAEFHKYTKVFTEISGAFGCARFCDFAANEGYDPVFHYARGASTFKIYHV
jgi:hypothetical protein